MPITSDYRYIKKSPNTEDLNLSYDLGHRVQSRQSHATQTKHTKPSLNLRICTEKSLCDDYNLLISCLNLFMDKIISFLIGKKYFKLQYQEFIIAFSHCLPQQTSQDLVKRNMTFHFPCFALPSCFKSLQAFFFFFLIVLN